MKRILGVVALASLLSVAFPVLAVADEVDDVCGTDPDCSVTPGGTFDTGPGIPDWFTLVFVLAACAAISFAIYRVSVARDLARKAGLDEGAAGAIALLQENGLSATYLASSLSRERAAAAGVVQQPRPAAERLAELQQLRDSGAITEDEYAARRQAIIDSV
jgi:hypothetical protein